MVLDFVQQILYFSYLDGAFCDGIWRLRKGLTGLSQQLIDYISDIFIRTIVTNLEIIHSTLLYTPHQPQTNLYIGNYHFFISVLKCTFGLFWILFDFCDPGFAC